MIDRSSLLVTGGTGSFGQHFIDHLLKTYNPNKIVIYSRNEANQCEMADRLSFYKDNLRFILGSVTDYDRLYRALKGIDIVVHAAALKVVPKAEYNPLEVLAVNTEGTRNVITACCERGVQKAVFLATDKAVMPVNLYGCTKAVAEKIWIESNYLEPIFSVVRYGNVMMSRGSVIAKFIEMRDRGEKEYPITHMDCTRFWVDFNEAIELVIRAIEDKPGLVLASKVKSFKVRDLIRAIYLRAEMKVTGLREGEKIHETLVSEYEAPRTKVLDTCYRIFPAFSFDDNILYEKEEGKDLERPIVSSDRDLIMGLEEVRNRVKRYQDN